MGKGPKHPLSFLDHLQICCPKNPNSLVKNPLPANTCIFSPSFPSHPTSTSRQSSRIESLDNCGSRSLSCTKHRMIDDGFQSTGYWKPRIEGEMMYNSPVSSDPDENDLAVAYSRIEKKSTHTIRKKSEARFYSGSSYGDSDETHSLFSASTSFNSSCSYSHPLNTISEERLNSRQKMMQQKHIGQQRFKRFSSKEWKHNEETVPLRESAEVRPISERLAPRIVVKRSVDPFWDFKRSMLEMIWDQKMSDPKEMENLLMSFLSLNSRQHHKVIIEAFAEIWKEMYCGSWH